MSDLTSPLVPRPRSIVFGEGEWVGDQESPRRAREILDPEAGLAAEGYRLRIGPAGAELVAGDEAGLFYGQQSLEQLSFFHSLGGEAEGFGIPSQLIEDAPRWPHRGFMLDVARHWFDAGEVRRLIELSARLKLNVFHWHLTDDQGWRLPVPSRPELTRRGPAYSAAEIRETVRFAAERQVMVIPEIDLPGHFRAALAAYPELGCRARRLKVPKSYGVFHDIACAGKDETLRFFEEVLEELLELFPGPFVHLGGDEVPKGRWERCAACQRRIKELELGDEEGLQAWLTNHLVDFLESRGKRAIVWNESLYSGSLDPRALVQHWKEDPDEGRSRAAAETGRPMILSDYSHHYLDLPHGLIPLSKVYAGSDWEGSLGEKAKSSLLGIEAPLWTEFVKNRTSIDRHCFPRLGAVAEQAWTSLESQDYPDFVRRLEGFRSWLASQAVYCVSAAFADPEPGSLSSRLQILSHFARAFGKPQTVFRHLARELRLSMGKKRRQRDARNEVLA